MQKARIILVLGVWMMALPYLGFYYSWKDFLTTLTGIVFVYMSYLLYQESKAREVKEEKNFDNFSENKFIGEGEVK